MTDYWNDLCNDLHGVTKEGNESNLAMLWGSFNEDSALVTYLGKKQIPYLFDYKPLSAISRDPKL